MVEREKLAWAMRRGPLSVHLLKANHVGRHVPQDRSQNRDPTLEFSFASTRHIEIFEIECRKAKGNGHQKAI
jgi:hypothetical protein